MLFYFLSFCLWPTLQLSDGWSGRWWFPSDAYQAVQVGLASLACLLFVPSVQRWVHEPWFRIPLDGVHERRSFFPHSLSLHPNFLPNTNSKCPSSNSVFREMLPSNGLQTLWSNPIKNPSRWVIRLLYIICQAIVSIAVSGCHRTEMQEMYMVVLKRCFFLYPTNAVPFVYAIPSILSSLFAALIFASEVNPDIRKECEWQPMHLLIARSRRSPDSLAARELFIGSLKEPRLMVFHRCLLAPSLVRGGDHGMEGPGGLLWGRAAAFLCPKPSTVFGNVDINC